MVLTWFDTSTRTVRIFQNDFINVSVQTNIHILNLLSSRRDVCGVLGWGCGLTSWLVAGWTGCCRSCLVCLQQEKWQQAWWRSPSGWNTPLLKIFSCMSFHLNTDAPFRNDKHALTLVACKVLYQIILTWRCGGGCCFSCRQAVAVWVFFCWRNILEMPDHF